MREPMDKNRIGGAPGRTSERKVAKSTSVKGRRDVNPAVVRRRRSDLPREICVVSQRWD
jgi:hypothetical protein